MRLAHLIRSVWKKYSLVRAYQNDFVRCLRLSGSGIDLGAKSKDAKYYEYMDMTLVKQLDFVDFDHAGDGVIQMDLEKRLPIEDRIYDFVISFNVIEHIYNYEGFISEAVRVLKEGGVIHGLVPFMVRFHPDPNDYFRFTWQALAKILHGQGIERVEIKPIASGPFKVAASQVGDVIKSRMVRFFLFLMGMWLDNLLSLVSSGSENYAMAYYFTGIKSGA